MSPVDAGFGSLLAIFLLTVSFGLVGVMCKTWRKRRSEQNDERQSHSVVYAVKMEDDSCASQYQRTSQTRQVDLQYQRIPKTRQIDSQYQRSPKTRQIDSQYQRSPKTCQIDTQYQRSPKTRQIDTQYQRPSKSRQIDLQYQRTSQTRQVDSQYQRIPKTRQIDTQYQRPSQTRQIDSQYQRTSLTRPVDSQRTNRQRPPHQNSIKDRILTPYNLPSYDHIISDRFNENVEPPPLYTEAIVDNLGAGFHESTV